MIKLVCCLLILTGIFNKKEDLQDFTASTTKVVLAGDNLLIDLIIKDAVEQNWKLSPYEFCTIEQYEKIKTDTTYYFLKRVNDEAVEFLTLSKGGEDDSYIISLPLSACGDSGDRIFTYIPAYLTMIQNHISKIIDRRLNAYIGMNMYSLGFNEAKGKKMYLHKDDVEEDIDFDSMYDEGVVGVIGDDELDRLLERRPKNTIVSLTVAPTNVPAARNLSYVYRMLIDVENSELMYYSKQRMNRRNGRKFQEGDMKRLSISF